MVTYFVWRTVLSNHTLCSVSCHGWSSYNYQDVSSVLLRTRTVFHSSKPLRVSTENFSDLNFTTWKTTLCPIFLTCSASFRGQIGWVAPACEKTAPVVAQDQEWQESSELNLMAFLLLNSFVLLLPDLLYLKTPSKSGLFPRLIHPFVLRNFANLWCRDFMRLDVGFCQTERGLF